MKVSTFTKLVEDYKKRFGYYPEAVLADQIYRNRENRSFCKAGGIRLSGHAFGRTKVGEEKHSLKKSAGYP
ncbi:hypothetical protein UF75_3174 [Desulfosporosinus sp. I2]|nr:hypothetical protein UF75_3174 [Desulfosporosinus sp. I2]